MNLFSEQIKSLRRELKLTQQEMADLGGTSRVNYSRYESGKNEPPITFLHNLYKNVPNLNIRFFFDGSENTWVDGEGVINEPSSDYVIEQLETFEDKAADLIDRIERGPWSVEAKLKMIESMIRIVEKSLDQ